jgi:uncharacterized protein
MMRLMKIDVLKLREGPIDLEIDCVPELLDLVDREYRFRKRVTGLVHFSLVEHRVRAKGFVETIAEAECVRCLKVVEVPLRGMLDIFYENNPALQTPEALLGAGEDENLYWFDGEVIHPEEQLREALMIELPMLPLCSPDCKGLCAQCGADLNEGLCACARGEREAEEEVEANDWKAMLRKIRLE